MVEVLLSILIVLVIAAASYYASLKYVELRHNRDVIADELQRATGHITELEERVIMLEAHLDNQRVETTKPVGASNGWDSLRG